jgi:hypothetical protein
MLLLILEKLISRADIERKKEELRKHISDRYRSVIESADSVYSMRNAVASLTTCVERLEVQLDNTTWASPEESYQSSKGNQTKSSTEACRKAREKKSLLVWKECKDLGGYT